MIEHLRSLNSQLINKYHSNPKKLERQLMISNFLNHKDCFFRINIEDAFKILKDLGISNYEETYINLISFDEYTKGL